MSSAAGPGLVTNGLILNVDASNRKSYIESAGSQASLINTYTWTLGTGSVTGFAANGLAAESQRIVDTDPWGVNAVVWGTYPSGDSNGDGGWEGSYFNIDRTKTYRSTVWVRRTSATSGGSFYHGLHTNGTGDTFHLADSVSQTNPYWDYRGTGNLTQNQWYLCVGHIYPSGYTGTNAHANSGFWTTSGSKVSNNAGNVSNDVKFPSDATQAYQRVYHFYCTDTTTRLQFAYPRWDIIDGNEPTISELLTQSPNKLYDLTGLGNHGTLTNNPSYSRTNKGVIVLDGANDYINFPLNMSSTNYTVIGAARYVTVSGRIFSALNNNWLMGHWGGTTENYYAEGWITSSGSGASDTAWRILAATGNISGDLYQMFVNGKSTLVANTGGSAGPNGFAVGSYAGTYEFSNAHIGCMLVYNRVLAESEINQNFNALRGRYGI